MAKEYIEREAVFDALFGQYCASCDETEQALNAAIEEIKAIPAADVVPVVRCGECKHFNDDDGDCRCVKDAEWDEETATWYGFVSYHMPDFFCADGERKDGDGDA